MKKIKYFFLLLFLFIFIFSLSVNAEETDDTSDIVMCDSAFEIGDTYSFYIKKTTSDNWEYEYILDYEITNDDGRYCCMYLTSDNKIYMLNAPMGIRNGYPPGSQTPQVSDFWFGNHDWIPFGYANSESYIVSSSGFSTNIPIFSSQADAELYVNGDSDLIKSAINYKKTYENGSWVRPFEDIEINDSNMLVPALTNVSHSGFSCTNNNDEKYLVEVYVSSGLQNIGNYLEGSTSISDPFVENSFGLVSNNSEAQYNGSSISLFDCYGVDNVNALYNNLIELYTTYPTVLSYQKGTDYEYEREDFTATSPCFFDIWGRYFGKTYMFWRTNHEVNTSDVDANLVEKIPICYTHYRVRYFYYDDESGFHYGPWANVVYFSNGKVVSNAIFQDDDGNIIETTINNGLQDESGNITYDSSEFIDIGNVNGLFGNIRSIFNNISATNGTFSQLFASVFNFLPPEILAIIFGGIGLMVFIGIVKACIG